MGTGDFAGNILNVFLMFECFRRNHNCSICPLYFKDQDMCIGDIMNYNVMSRRARMGMEEFNNEEKDTDIYSN